MSHCSGFTRSGGRHMLFWPWMSVYPLTNLCLLSITSTLGGIFKQLITDVYQFEKMFEAHESLTSAQGQGHIVGSRVTQLYFMSTL